MLLFNVMLISKGILKYFLCFKASTFIGQLQLNGKRLKYFLWLMMYLFGKLVLMLCSGCEWCAHGIFVWQMTVNGI